MAAIQHVFVEQNTQQITTSGTYADVSGAAITSGNFTVGKKYLLYITAQIGEDASGFIKMRTLHGSTVFDESEMVFPASSIIDESNTYCFMTVWTAVSGEGIKLQFAVTAANGYADAISLLAINLSDDLTENVDWVFAQRTTDDALSTTPTDGASVTITPSEASDWLVLTTAQHDAAGSATLISRIVRSGEASSSFPESRVFQTSATTLHVAALARVYALTATSNTFKEQSESSASSGIRLHSSIFILNLNQFKVHANAYTEAEAALSATNYATQLQTTSITPTVTGDVWIGANWVYDVNSTARYAEFRTQVDNSDQPAGQTTDLIKFTNVLDATNELSLVLSTMASLSNAAHTIDLDASVDSTAGAGAGQQRTLWAVTMELQTAFSIAADSGSYAVTGIPAVLRPTGITILQHRR